MVAVFDLGCCNLQAANDPLIEVAIAVRSRNGALL
jgi:hypothetical protein